MATYEDHENPEITWAFIHKTHAQAALEIALTPSIYADTYKHNNREVLKMAMAVHVIFLSGDVPVPGDVLDSVQATVMGLFSNDFIGVRTKDDTLAHIRKLRVRSGRVSVAFSGGYGNA